MHFNVCIIDIYDCGLENCLSPFFSYNDDNQSSIVLHNYEMLSNTPAFKTKAGYDTNKTTCNYVDWKLMRDEEYIVPKLILCDNNWYLVNNKNNYYDFVSKYQLMDHDIYMVDCHLTMLGGCYD